MPDRVVEQDHHQLVETVRVAGNLDAARRFQLEELTGRQCLGGAHRLRCDLVQPYSCAANRGRAPRVVSCIRIRAGEQQEVVEQPAHAVALAADVVKCGSEIGRVEPATAETRLAHQHVDVAPDRGQWCAQLV